MDRLFTFSAGETGAWRLTAQHTVAGDPLPAGAPRLDVAAGDAAGPALWRLKGVTSNLRYTTGAEQRTLVAVQEEPGRAGSTCAALISIRKSPAWWRMPQDERRAILEERSRHIAIGLRYLPAIARRLHHGRDLGESFDFLTWFEFAPADAPAFDDLLAALRATEEWRYVDREVEIRLAR